MTPPPHVDVSCILASSHSSHDEWTNSTSIKSAWELSEGTSAHHKPPPCVQELHHKNRYWHEDCFRCAKCYKPLASEPFSARDDGKIMCGKCGAREDGNRCQGCYKVVMPGGLLFVLIFYYERIYIFSQGYMSLGCFIIKGEGSKLEKVRIKKRVKSADIWPFYLWFHLIFCDAFSLTHVNQSYCKNNQLPYLCH